MRTIISFAALFLSVALVQLGAGSLGPIDALAGASYGFTTGEIGMMGSAHFLGFFIGCWATPRLMGSVGHVRGFVVMASVGAVAALMHPLLIDPIAWSVFRVGSGAAVAGAYTIVESWLHAKTANKDRGQVFSIYRVVDMTASIGAQGLVAALDPGSYVAYNVIAALCCLCLLPLALTRSTPPSFAASPRLRPLRAISLSPLGAVTVMVVGLTSSSFRMVGPIYALQNGLTAAQTALFLASGVAGGALAQWPAGWLSDKIDRRVALVGLSVAAIVVCIAIASGDGLDARRTYLSAFAFGAAAFPLYSIAAAHANDFAAPEDAIELNAALVFLFGVGAIVSPLISAGLIERFGPSALFLYVAFAHVTLILFAIWRAFRRPAVVQKTPHRIMPRTSFTLGQLFRQRK